MDTSYEDVGRIPKTAAFVSPGGLASFLAPRLICLCAQLSSIALYVIAVTAAILRGFVRWHYGQLRLLDDGFVCFAVACLTASFGLWMTYISDVYVTEALVYEPFKYPWLFTNILEIAVEIQLFSAVYVVISLTGIFAIKFSFLCFFRHLIDRLHGLQIYWRCIACYTTAVWIISICLAPTSCPFYDSRAGTSS